MANETRSDENQSDIYRQLDDYPWDQDREFQGGLSAILGPHPIPSQIYELTLRARCFYFSRKTSVPVSFDGYKAYILALESHQTPLKPQAEPSHASVPIQTAPYPPSFAEIIRLISNNATIPGIRDIPPTIIPEQASVATAPKRKKPWDKNTLEKKIYIGSQKSFEESTILQKSIETER
ncbi:hypothetical protein OnM2_064028 [Erysiphe neolycopersici]|uniref:Uncharacterized protein n=1 Tax=Erysiphe neolycopersici TaxID=212602 RepID=A0A420HNG7_9PEZI|nr:hypothetical protein OnM2_064028 [Erysiphe neolycopersici]